MLIVWCLGGLGNQMFQYAFYRVLRAKHKNVKLDISEYEYRNSHNNLHNGYELERVFGVKPDYASCEDMKKFNQNIFNKILRKVAFKQDIVSQKDFGYSGKYFNLDNKYLKGYWQSEKYFKQYEDVIREDFTFPALDQRNEKIAEDIFASDSVSIHVRMGDYVNHPLHGGICDLEYYAKAIEIIYAKIREPRFFIFSNDIAWCQNNLGLSNAVYVEGNYGDKSYIDMQLMSLCKHNIIANSSFSWWGAWLNQNIDKIVIAPKKWFNDSTINIDDVIPDEWVKI